MIGPTFTPEEIAKYKAIEIEAKESLRLRWATRECPPPSVPTPMYYLDTIGKIRRAPQP